MSNRADRREAERTARKLAHQQLHQQPSAAAAPAVEPVAVEPVVAETSAARLEANRANAQLSTGPVTPEGKAVSSRNNTRHGLAVDTGAGNFQVLDSENPFLFERNLAGFHAEWKPVTATELDLVNRLAMHQWLRMRALRLQESLFKELTGEITDIKKFDLYRRYETAHERGFNKVLADLQRLRTFQMRQQNGFESQKRKTEEHQFKIRRLKAEEEKRATGTPRKVSQDSATSPEIASQTTA